MINQQQFSNQYDNTYYVEIKGINGLIETYEKVSGDNPIQVARHFKSDAVKCDKKDATIMVISNARLFGKKVRNNYYK